MHNLTNEKVIHADPVLGNVHEIAKQERFGFFKVILGNYQIYCVDLLSFYMAAKDIFIHQIYRFNTNNPTPKVIDGGGHIGLFTLYAKIIHPNSEITVFEPDELSLKLLRMNIEVNKLQNVTIVEAGLHDKEGELYFNSDGSDGSSLTDKDNASTSIKITRLSSYIDRKIDFIKLNIEGSELNVIKDVEPLLGNTSEIVIEYHGFPELGQKLHLILEILDRQGFRYMLHDFDAQTNGASKPPFFIEKDTRFFQLIYGRKLFEKKEKQKTVNRETTNSNELQRTDPICREFGFSRGTPIDRYYIEKFLETNSEKITGNVLEIGDSNYSRKFGKNVKSFDVLNTVPGGETTIVADLSQENSLAKESFDCIILTQTLQFIYDHRNALDNLIGALKKGGNLLLTASGISQISRYDMDRWGEFWRFTDKSLQKILNEHGKRCEIHVESHGNLATAKAFLDGRAYEEFDKNVLDVQDNDYQLLLTAKIEKESAVEIKEIPEKTPIVEKQVAPESKLIVERKVITESKKDLNYPSILLYHRVINDSVNSQLLSVTPENFAAQVEFVKNNFRVLFLEELVDELKCGKLEKNTVALTFDDGYFDNYQFALPILEQYKVPATFFVSSNFIDSNKELYWDALERLILLEKLPIEVLNITINNKNVDFPLRTSQERLESYDSICSLIKQMNVEQRDTFVDQLYKLCNIENSARATHRGMTLHELLELNSSPFADIGVHTANHACLGNLTYEDQQKELLECKSFLEDNLRTTMQLCSYPWGSLQDYNQHTIEIAKELNFKAGIANIQGDCRIFNNAFEVPRLLVRDYNIDTFKEWVYSEEKEIFERNEMKTRNNILGTDINASSNFAY